MYDKTLAKIIALGAFAIGFAMALILIGTIG